MRLYLCDSRVYGKSNFYGYGKIIQAEQWCPISPWKVIGEFESIHWRGDNVSLGNRQDGPLQ